MSEATIYLAGGQAFEHEDHAAWAMPGEEIVPVELNHSYKAHYYIEKQEGRWGTGYAVLDCSQMSTHNESTGHKGHCYPAYDEAHALTQALADATLETVKAPARVDDSDDGDTE